MTKSLGVSFHFKEEGVHLVDSLPFILLDNFLL